MSSVTKRLHKTVFFTRQISDATETSYLSASLRAGLLLLDVPKASSPSLRQTDRQADRQADGEAQTMRVPMRGASLMTGGD